MQPKAEIPKVGLFPAKLLAQQCGGCQNRGLAKPQTNSQPNTITKARIFTQFFLKVRNVNVRQCETFKVQKLNTDSVNVWMCERLKEINY